MPRVSICIPAYNQVKYLRKTLDSVLAQSFDDYEIIITDDSPDNQVKDLVGEYNFGGRLKYYYNDPALGSPKNWNFCIDQACGDYIKILHHDDWFNSENSLADFVDALEMSGAALAFSDAEVIYEKNNQKGFHAPGTQNIKALSKDPTILYAGNFIGAPSMTMYKRDDLLRFDINLKWLVDIDFYIRYLKIHRHFIYIDKPLMSIVAEAGHTVTAICSNNKEIEIFENFYVHQKLKSTLTIGQNIRNSFLLFRLLRRFNILKLDDVKQSGYTERLSYAFKLLFLLDRSRDRVIYFLRKSKRFIQNSYSQFDTNN